MSDDAAVFGDDDDQTGDDQVFITKEGLQKLRDELEILKTVRRQELAKRLKEAISYGDLSENSEYEEAKNEQAFVEGRILELEQMIKGAKLIDAKREKDVKIVDIGSHVTVVHAADSSKAETFVIVGSTEADPLDHKISNESPVGKSLVGHKKGDVVTVEAPSGIQKYEITKVS